MEQTPNQVEILQQQLNETNQKLKRSLDLNNALKIEKERLAVENYSLHRQVAVLQNRYEEIKKRAAGVTESATKLEIVVNGLLPEFQAEQARAHVQVKPSVQVTPKPTVQVTPKSTAQVTPKPVLGLSPIPMSAVPAIVMPIQKPVELSSRIPQTEQKISRSGGIVNFGKYLR